MQSERTPRIGIGGSVALTYRLRGAIALGGSLAWAPQPNLFVRTGFSLRGLEKLDLTPDFENDISWWWGLGYDDWRPNTLSIQINNWGPIPLGSTDVFSGAVADLGYKLPAISWDIFRLSSSLHVSSSFKRGLPTFSGSVSLSALQHLSGFVTLRADPFAKDLLSWNYGFGISDWHPFTFSCVYTNWGPNKINEPNFFSNGAVSLSFSYAL